MPMLTTKRNEKIFWRHKAGKYPAPFDPETLKKTLRIIKKAEGLGADFRGRDLLDIGCGTGIYALALAKKARSVVGLDSSAGMLSRFRAEAKERRIKNAAALKSAWGDLAAARVVKKFDIALASMTHAVIKLSDLEKMEAASRELCVYIGWAGVRKNAFLQKVYSHHGVKYEAPAGAEKIVPLLKKLGRDFRAVYIKDSWRSEGKPEEVLKDIKVTLKINGARPDRDWLDKFIRRKTKNGTVTQITAARKGLIVWRPV